MSIFVGGVPYTLSKREFEELARQKIGAEHFQSGSVTDANLLMDGDRNKGFGFIKTNSLEVANSIVEKANSGISSQTWTVEGATLQLRIAAKSQKEQQPPARFDQPQEGSGMFSGGGRGGRGRGGGDMMDRGRGMMPGRGGMRGRGGDNFHQRGGRGGAGDFNNRYQQGGAASSIAGAGQNQEGEDPNSSVNLPLALAWAHYKVVFVANCGTQLPASLTKEEEASCILETAETAQHTFVVMRKNQLEVKAAETGRPPRGRGRGRGFLQNQDGGDKDEEWDRVKTKLEEVGFKPTHAPSLKRMRDAAGDSESRAATKEEIMQSMLELRKQNGKYVAIAEPRKESATTVVLVPRSAVSFQPF